jgi:glycosyltransferase involved in cell wall biosynthesis
VTIIGAVGEIFKLQDLLLSNYLSKIGLTVNILVLSWRDPKHPMAGGAEQVMHEHMKGWIEMGHTVTLFSSFFSGCASYESLDGVKILRRGGQLLEVQIRAFLWYWFRKHEKFDLVVDQFHGVPFFTPLYMRIPKLAVLQEVAREVWLQNHLPKPINYIIGFTGYVLEPVFFLFYKRVPFMTGSESAKKDLITIGIPSKNIVIVPHGVKLDIPSKLPKKEKTKTVIFLGALAKDKGIEDALKTFAILNRKGEYQFWVIGKAGSSYKEELEELVTILGIVNRVRFWGFVSDRKKFELLARGHVLINPSMREGWGLVNIEANAVGTPIVAYSSAGLVDSVKNGINGFLCEENTPNNLADHVYKLLKDSGQYKKLQLSSIKWSNNFDWKSSKQKSLKLISKIVTSYEKGH